MQPAYTHEDVLLTDLKVWWSGNRTTSVWTDYNTIGKVLKQLKAVWPGYSGLIAIANPDGQTLISVLYSPINDNHSGELDYID